jgi:hypothetical protein
MAALPQPSTSILPPFLLGYGLSLGRSSPLRKEDPLKAMIMASRAQFGTNQFVIVTMALAGLEVHSCLKAVPPRCLSDLVPSDSCI